MSKTQRRNHVSRAWNVSRRKEGRRKEEGKRQENRSGNRKLKREGYLEVRLVAQEAHQNLQQLLPHPLLQSASRRLINRWINGRTGGVKNGRTNGRMDERTTGRNNRSIQRNNEPTSLLKTSTSGLASNSLIFLGRTSIESLCYFSSSNPGPLHPQRAGSPHLVAASHTSEPDLALQAAGSTAGMIPRLPSSKASPKDCGPQQTTHSELEIA